MRKRNIIRAYLMGFVITGLNASLASEVPSTAPVAATQPAASIKTGLYKGAAEGPLAFTVTLVSTDKGLAVSDVGYKLGDSASVKRVFLKKGQPLGHFVDGKTTIQFPILTAASVANLNVPKLDLSGMKSYKAEIAINADGKLNCVLTQIPALDEAFSGVNFEGISFWQSEKVTFEQQYVLVLKPDELTAAEKDAITERLKKKRQAELNQK